MTTIWGGLVLFSRCAIAVSDYKNCSLVTSAHLSSRILPDSGCQIDSCWGIQVQESIQSVKIAQCRKWRRRNGVWDFVVDCARKITRNSCCSGYVAGCILCGCDDIFRGKLRCSQTGIYWRRFADFLLAALQGHLLSTGKCCCPGILF